MDKVLTQLGKLKRQLVHSEKDGGQVKKLLRGLKNLQEIQRVSGTTMNGQQNVTTKVLANLLPFRTSFLFVEVTKFLERHP